MNTSEYISRAGSWYEDQSLGVSTIQLHVGQVVGMKTNHLV